MVDRGISSQKVNNLLHVILASRNPRLKIGDVRFR